MRLSTIGPAVAVAVAVTVSVAGLAPPSATAVGPGGWDHLGSQVLFGSTASALNGSVLAMSTAVPGQLIAGGEFTDAGGVSGANHIASWNGTAWSRVGPASSFNGQVDALAYAGGKLYAGGTFTDGAGPQPDFLAVYDGVTWAPFCSGGLGGNVDALRVVGNYLYVGGEFQDGGMIPSADYLMRCDLSTGASSSTVDSVLHSFNGPVYALTSDSAGNVYAGGGFSNLEGNLASDKVAMFNGTVWSNLGAGGPAGGAVDSFVRSLADDGTTLYIGADSVDIGGLSRADHVAAWDGTSWHALGANAAGTDGYLPAVTSIDALFTVGQHVYASGNWLDVGGDPTSDYLADFDGTAWHPVGSNGAGDGALAGKGQSFALFGGVLHVGGNFTKAGGDSLAQFVARFTGVPVAPSNVATVGKAKANKRKGTATLPVTVPGPGTLVLSGKGIKSATQPRAVAGIAQLKVTPKGKILKQLKAHGKAKVTVTVTFTPTGGTARAVTAKVKLVRRP